MTADDLANRIADAIAAMEGFRNPRSLAHRNANPGNVRQWRSGGDSYPTSGGYVDFVQWAADHYPDAGILEARRIAEDEGWRVLRVLARKYIQGDYTSGKPPTFYEMFARYAPAADKNEPQRYAEFVAARLGVDPKQRIIDLIDGGKHGRQ